MRKKVILIVCFLFIFIAVVVAVWWFVSLPKANENYINEASSLYKDKDTGEVLLNDPNIQEPQERRSVIVLGVEDLTKKGYLSKSIVVLRKNLELFAAERLGGAYQTITIRPQDTRISQNGFFSTIRLGETDIFLPIEVTFVDNGVSRVVVRDPLLVVGGDYDSGELSVRAD